jgi:hypothetical protein
MKDDKVFRDWIPRGGDNVILRADRVSSNPSSGTGITVTIRVFTKSSDETGDGFAVQQSGSSTPLSFTVLHTDTTVKELIVSSVATTTSSNPKGLKQLVRLELVAWQRLWNTLRLWFGATSGGIETAIEFVLCCGKHRAAVRLGAFDYPNHRVYPRIKDGGWRTIADRSAGNARQFLFNGQTGFAWWGKDAISVWEE